MIWNFDKILSRTISMMPLLSEKKGGKKIAKCRLQVYRWKYSFGHFGFESAPFPKTVLNLFRLCCEDERLCDRRLCRKWSSLLSRTVVVVEECQRRVGVWTQVCWSNTRPVSIWQPSAWRQKGHKPGCVNSAVIIMGATCYAGCPTTADPLKSLQWNPSTPLKAAADEWMR